MQYTGFFVARGVNYFAWRMSNVQPAYSNLLLFVKQTREAQMAQTEQQSRSAASFNSRCMQKWKRLQSSFEVDFFTYWNALGHLNNLSILLNISAFFLTGLISQGYYFTFYSLFCLSFVGFGMLVPTVWVRRLKYYLFFLFVEALGLYFLISSVIYWVTHNGIRVQMG